MRIVLIGPQGSGKGTQAALLAEHYKIPHISSGEILREEKASGSALGKKIQSLIDTGTFVPDEMVQEMIAKRLKKGDCKKGFIIEGFPRNVPQAEWFDNRFAIDKVFELAISDETACKRISGRSKTQGRADDKPELVKKRLGIYHEQTKPVLSYYKKQKKLIAVDGEQSIENIKKQLLERLSESI